MNFHEIIKSSRVNRNQSYNYLSYGEIKCRLLIEDSDLLYTFIAKDKSAKKYAFIDIKSEYYMMIWDIDLKQKDFVKYGIKLLKNRYTSYILKIILDVMRQLIDVDNFYYIYLDKSDGTPGVHLHFPNIIVNNAHGLYMANRVIEKIKSDNRYRFPDALIEKIIDKTMYSKTGMRMIYQKVNGAFYRINTEKSTYRNIPKNRVEQLRLLSLKTTEAEINFVPRYRLENKVSLMDHQPFKGEKEKEAAINYLDELEEETGVDKEIIKRILYDGVMNLDKKRNNDYNGWLEVGILCYKFGDFGIKTWIDFSKQGDNFDLTEIERKIDSFYVDKKKMPIGMLFTWLQTENPPFYKQFYDRFREEINRLDPRALYEYLRQQLREKDCGYVKLYYDYFKDDLVCTCQEKNTFYMYVDRLRLWRVKTAKEIQLHFMNQMRLIVKPLADHYKGLSADCRQKEKPDTAKKYARLAEQVESTPGFTQSSRAKSLMTILVAQFYREDFIIKLDSRRDSLPIKGGLIDLRTGEFKEREKTDYYTFELNVEWRGVQTGTPNIDKFMADIMLDDMNMVDFLQRLLGYSITGYVNEGKFIVLWGCGGNGKGVLMTLLKELLKGFYRQASSDVVIENKKTGPGAATPHLMQLIGARIAVVDESELGAKLNEAVVKNITGGGSIVARPLYGNLITFEPTFQLILLTNHKPVINVNPSIKRRLILLPFLAEFKSGPNLDPTNRAHRQGDKNIEQKLLKHLDELLVWLIKGSIKYFEKGLDEMPATVMDATNEYLNENDDIGSFIEEHCEVNKQYFEYCADLHTTFNNNYKQISKNLFKKLLKEKGFPTKRRRQGVGFEGLKLKEIEDEL